MRHSNPSRGLRPSAVPAGLLVVLAVALIGCGPSAVASTSPTPRPTPVVTPDPHLSEPVTADEIFQAIGSIDLPFVANNATPGGAGDALIKKINAELSSWPLIITEYRSSADLRAATGWDPATPPIQGDPPFAWVGLNVLIEFGPSTGVRLGPPDEGRQEQARQVVAILDPLLWPLEQRSVVPVPSRTATPGPGSAAPSASAAPASAAP